MSDLFKNKQILALFVISFAVMFTGMGLFPLLPLLAAEFDAGSSTTGFYLASIYAANSLAPAAAGWLITRVSKKAVFIAGSLAGLPALVGLGLAQDFPQVVAATSLLWFSGGMVMALVSILTGEYTGASEQGKAFSLMAMVGPLGSLAGGGVVGQLVTWQGYPVMFLVLAAFWTIIPLTGWLFLKDRSQSAAPAKRAITTLPAAPGAGLGALFARAAAVIFVGSIAVNVSRFGASLSMQSLAYTPEGVSQVAMLSGLVAIPATLAAGALSDRLGRKHFLTVSYLFAMSGALILTGAREFWQFSLASILLMLAFSISGAMSQAVTSELVPALAASKGLSWLNTLGAAASILCFAAGGLLYDLLGMPVMFAAGAVVALAAGTGIEALVHTHSPAAVVEDGCEA